MPALLTFADLTERAEILHRETENTLVETGEQVPMLAMFGARSGILPYSAFGRLIQDEAVTMAVRALAATGLMMIGLAQRATVLLGTEHQPVAAVHHRREPGDAGLELWSIAVHRDDAHAVSHLTPVHRAGGGFTVGERSRTVKAVCCDPDAQRLMAILAASR